jgi:hypothetical protein
MTIRSSWLIRGYFNLSEEDRRHTTTQEIRDTLSTALGVNLQIAMYPVGPNWKHTFWWREGTADYAEAQFFVRIDEDCPVLSLGVSVEKGREGSDAGMVPAQRMDRGIWDWSRLIERRLAVLASVPEIAVRLQQPVSLRVRAYDKPYDENQLVRSKSLTFSFVDGQWFQRHQGSANVATIASFIERLDQEMNLWIDLYFAVDLAPSIAEGMTGANIAGLLLRFEPIRRQLKAAHVFT